MKLDFVDNYYASVNLIVPVVLTQSYIEVKGHYCFVNVILVVIIAVITPRFAFLYIKILFLYFCVCFRYT